MIFGEYLYLYLAPLAGVVMGLLIAAKNRRRRRLRAEFAGGAGRSWSEPGQVDWRRRAESILIPLAVCFLFLSFARPMLYKHGEHSELQGIPYIVALDASRSMLVRDVRPNRWSAATNAVDRFIAESKGDRIGLITFSGVANLNAPLSFDPTAIRTLVRFTSPEHYDPDPATAGSSIGKAIERAGRYFASNSISPRVVILVSDGEDFDDDLFSQARQWGKTGLHVCAIGVGSTGGGRVPPSPWGGAARDAVGQEVVSRLIESNLERLAAITGGKYYRLGERGDGFDRLRQEYLRPMAQTAAKADLQNYSQWFQVPLGFALVCMAGAVWVGADRIRRPLSLPPIAGVKR